MAAILFMQIRWSRTQNFAWEPARAYRIQHTQNRLKSLVPNFYLQMPLTFTFSRNPTRLFGYKQKCVAKAIL